ncbi:alpha/beta-hydrolase [Xylariaceae sp. FL0016]|nr:alpha/beta-hydrolase [Xylariaceae sp. FL0016]
MEQLKNFGTSIEDVLMPTFGAYEKLLVAKEAEIRSTRHDTHKYGPDPRQELDIYYPKGAPTAPFTATPVLVFCYGGGFVGGDKVNKPYANGLIFGNIGHYFASKYGFTVIVPDYRLLSHGAKYPSGGEDVKLVVDWITNTLSKQEGYDAIDLVLMGNSAGGVHVGTYLFDPTFAESRKSVLAAQRKGKGTQLTGSILLGVPMHWGKEDNEVLRGYFGEGKIYERSPMGLIEAAQAKGSGLDLPGLKLSVMVSELDPDFIIDSAEEFKKLCQGIEVEVEVLKGHNHISVQLGLSTGIEHEEAWGIQVAEFCKKCAT